MSDINVELGSESKAGVPMTLVTGVDGLQARNNSAGARAGANQGLSNDEAVLAKFGKKQVLQRRFKSISTIGLTCGLMLSWIAVSGALQVGMPNGGPASLVWGFLAAFIGAMLQALVMGEISSMIPLSGGAFNWVAILAPPKYRRFLSYIAGWFTVMSYQTYVLGVCYGSASFIRGLIILSVPGYVPQLWHTTLMSYAVALVGFFTNTYLGRILPQIESFMLALVVLGYFAILIPLVYLSPHRNASDVFFTFLNVAGWENDGISFLVGFTGVAGAFLGAEGADHIAEEIESAAKVIPMSMWVSTLLNGVLAFGLLIAVLFVTPDFVAAASPVTGFVYIDVFAAALDSIPGAVGLTAILIAINILSISSLMATASRALWAFAREKGVPFSDFVVRLDPKTRLPYNAICITVAIEVLLALISVGSSTAYQAFGAVVLAVYFSLFIVAASVMLYKRLTTPESEIAWGPFRLGRWGVPITIIAIIYSLVIVIFSFFPLYLPVTPENMNYSCLIYGAALLVMLGFWFIHGHRVYKGPIWELDGNHVRRG